MEYIDLGLPSGNLFAVEDLQKYYTFEEAKEKFGNSLPTLNEVKELLRYTWKNWIPRKKGLDFLGLNGNRLFLPAGGKVYQDRLDSKGHWGVYLIDITKYKHWKCYETAILSFFPNHEIRITGHTVNKEDPWKGTVILIKRK